jgi:hypothetical protein
MIIVTTAGNSSPLNSTTPTAPTRSISQFTALQPTVGRCPRANATTIQRTMKVAIPIARLWAMTFRRGDESRSPSARKKAFSIGDNHSSKRRLAMSQSDSGSPRRSPYSTSARDTRRTGPKRPVGYAHSNLAISTREEARAISKIGGDRASAMRLAPTKFSRLIFALNQQTPPRHPRGALLHIGTRLGGRWRRPQCRPTSRSAASHRAG